MKGRMAQTAFLAILGGVAFGADVTWTGKSGDGQWSTPGNWSGNAVPTSKDTAVFDTDGEVTVSLPDSTTSQPLGGISVTKGTVDVGGGLGRIRFYGAPTVIHVESGASLTLSAKRFASTSKPELRKTGGGTFSWTGQLGWLGTEYPFGSVVVEAGVFRNGAAGADGIKFVATNLTVCAGATFAATAAIDGKLSGVPVSMAQGAVLSLIGAFDGSVKSLSGAGSVLHSGDGTAKLSAPLAGDFELEDAAGMSLVLTTDAGNRLVVANADTLATTALTCNGDGLAFRGGIGTFRIGSLTSNGSVANVDLDGEPVRMLGASGAAYLQDLLTVTDDWGVGYASGAAAAKLSVTGGTVRLGGASARPAVSELEVTEGILELTRNFTKQADATALTLAADGATLRVLPYADGNGAIALPYVAGTLAVGEKGARLEHGCAEMPYPGYGSDTCKLTWNFSSETAAGLATDGGLSFAWPYHLELTKPQAVKGPFIAADGEIGVKSAAGPTAFGAGDFTLGSAYVYIDAKDADVGLRLAAGTGARFTYGRGGALCLAVSGTTQGQTVTVGPDDAAASPIVRAGKGAALFVTRQTNNAKIDGGIGRMLANGGVATYANGLVKESFFACSKVGGSNELAYQVDLMKYDATLGFVRCNDLYTAFGESGENSIALATDGAAVAENGEKAILALVVNGSTKDAKPLVVGAGGRLTVGNGTDPALVALNSSGGYGGARVTGTGTIDFRAGEAVIATATYDADHASEANRTCIEPTIAGSGGVTYVAMPGLTHPAIRILGSNTYSGGTYVSGVRLEPGTATAFGTDCVDVGGGMNWGGQICFVKANLAFANSFRLHGNGVRGYGSASLNVDLGALNVRANTTLDGAVAIDGEARVFVASNRTATVNGVVSGGKLKLMQSAGRLVLANANTYAGGTALAAGSTLVLRQAASAGTGEVLVDASTLELDNDADAAFANALRGNGTVKLCGAGAADFTGAVDPGLTLDLNGGGRTFVALPAFGRIANSSATRATLELAGNLGTVAWSGAEIVDAATTDLVVGDGTTLDLGDTTLTVRRLTGAVVNGTVNELNPRGGLMLFVR